jgi:hypothetical protein
MRLEKELLEVVKTQFNQLTERTTRDENFKLGGPVFSVEQDNDKTAIGVAIYFSGFSLHVTTPDLAFGMGMSRDDDPYIGVSVVIKGRIPVYQNKTLESIRFLSTQWSLDYKIDSYKGDKITFKNSLKKPEIEQWVNYQLPLQSLTVLNSLNFENLLNAYLNEKVKSNKALRMEIDLDNDDNIEVNQRGQEILVFQHRYSSAGILKRSAGKDASVITEEQHVKPAVPPTDKPGDIKDGPNSTKPVSTVPTTSTSNSPGGVNTGPSSTKNPSTVPKSSKPGGINNSPSLPKKQQ